MAILEFAGTEGRSAFRALLSDDSPYVRMWVASQLLADGEEEAVEVVESLTEARGPLGHGARIALGQWRAGEHSSPFDDF